MKRQRNWPFSFFLLALVATTTLAAAGDNTRYFHQTTTLAAPGDNTLINYKKRTQKSLLASILECFGRECFRILPEVVAEASNDGEWPEELYEASSDGEWPEEDDEASNDGELPEVVAEAPVNLEEVRLLAALSKQKADIVAALLVLVDELELVVDRTSQRPRHQHVNDGAVPVGNDEAVPVGNDGAVPVTGFLDVLEFLLPVLSPDQTKAIRATNKDSKNCIQQIQDIEFLGRYDHYKGINNEPAFDNKILEIIEEMYNGDKAKIERARKFLNDARTKADNMMGSYYTLLEELEFKSWKRLEFRGNLPIKDLSTKVVRDARSIEVQWCKTPYHVDHISASAEVYNDDKNMDLLFSLMLVEGKGQHVMRGPMGFEGLVRFLKWNIYDLRRRDCKRNHVPWQMEWTDGDEGALTEVLAVRKEEALYQALTYWSILQDARKAIKTHRSNLSEGSPLKNPYAQNRNVDAQMIKELVPLLQGTATEAEIQKYMEQARHANTFKIAVRNKMEEYLRKLVASKIHIPVCTFNEIVDEAEKDEKVLEILRKHPQFKEAEPDLIGICKKSRRYWSSKLF